MRKLYCLILTLACAAMSIDATAQGYMSELRPWEDGPLSWDDFRTIQPYDDTTASKLVYWWKPGTVKEKYGNLVVQKIVVTNYFDRAHSWAAPEYRSDIRLKYNQTIFNIAELYKRKLQLEYDLSFPASIEPMMQFYNRSAGDAIEEFQRKVSFGRDSLAIEGCARKVEAELSDYQGTDIHFFSCRDFGYGIYFGIGTMFPFGETARYFSPNVSFLFGFEFAYRRSSWYLGASVGPGKVREEIPGNSLWKASDSYASSNLDVFYRYALVDNDWWKIGPFAGVGISIYEAFVNHYELGPTARALGGIKFSIGAEADWKFRRKLALAWAPFAFREYMENSVKARLYVSKENYFNAFGGWSVNFSLNFSLFARIIKSLG